jgi:hypothetical protein
MPKRSLFSKKKRVNLKKDAGKARFLIRKLFSLTLVRIFLGILALLIFGPVILFFIYRPKPLNDINYGVNFSDKYARELGLDWQDAYIKVLDDLKVKELRLVAYWDEIETEPDNYNFENIKWQLEEAQKRDVKVILAIGRKVPRFPECFEPSWWNDIQDEEIRNLELYEYVKTGINELKGYENIKMWQVENEPFWPFGDCKYEHKINVLDKEVKLVRSLDDRPILVQDSGEGGLWKDSYNRGDYLAISMYRKIWYDFWGVFLGRSIYFQYPLAHWTYKIKSHMVGVPYQRIIVTELQGEPWGPDINSKLTDEEKDKSFSRNDYTATLSYAQKAGFKDIYLWGTEWWLWEKEMNNNPFFWDASKALFR